MIFYVDNCRFWTHLKIGRFEYRFIDEWQKSTRWLSRSHGNQAKAVISLFDFFETLKDTLSTSQGFRSVAFIVRSWDTISSPTASPLSCLVWIPKPKVSGLWHLLFLRYHFNSPWCLMWIAKPLVLEGLRQSVYVKDDCSSSKLLGFSLIIGDFYHLWELGLKPGHHIVVAVSKLICTMIKAGFYSCQLICQFTSISKIIFCINCNYIKTKPY